MPLLQAPQVEVRQVVVEVVPELEADLASIPPRATGFPWVEWAVAVEALAVTWYTN